ncbi:MAG: D-TA family PLP-dependent enzyme [Planctomycetaceae bacterium]|nr:D-TA family PLP-dependent enzyme [Planctomycetaceae bacterium]
MSQPWYAVENIGEIPGPALLIYPDRVERNLQRMIAAAGGPERLRPHVKTHKMAEVVRMKLAAGITKFKAATIAESELCASCGAPDVLLSFPQTGPNIDRLVRLVATFPNTHFSTLTDDEGHALHLSTAFAQVGRKIEVWLDVDVGQHRSGIAPDERAVALYRRLHELPGTTPGGLHVYDGHVREQDLGERIAHGESSYAAVDALIKRLHAAGLPMQRPICGGTPSFPVHSRQAERDCSPGTCVFFDISYATKFPDLGYEYAALVMGRVVSKPGGDRVSIELGYKAVSPDNPTLRVQLLDVPDAKVFGQWEEHLTVETPAANRFSVGDVVYGVPNHICPTVALFSEAYTVRNGRVDGVWKVAARDRRITI